jgi:putative ABC transport system ATP-binding protein
METGNVLYELTGVSKVYHKGHQEILAVRDLDLRIREGEWLAIQGKTGHGKSTLLQLLGGLDRPTRGSVRFGGTDLATARDGAVRQMRARSFGFVFQSFNLIPTLTAHENVEAALVPLGTVTAERRERTARALELVGLADRARHLPTELSGGQQQRVAIARALVKDPKVLLADEPTGNLDEDTRDDIIALLRGLWRARGLTLVLVSHDSQVVAGAQRIGVMTSGRLRLLPLAESGGGRRDARGEHDGDQDAERYHRLRVARRYQRQLLDVVERRGRRARSRVRLRPGPRRRGRGRGRRDGRLPHQVRRRLGRRGRGVVRGGSRFRPVRCGGRRPVDRRRRPVDRRR